MFSQLREIKRRQQLRDKLRKESDQSALTQRMNTTSSISQQSVTNRTLKQPMPSENHPIVNRNTIHTTKPSLVKQQQPQRSTVVVNKLRECPSSTSTIGNSSKVSSIGSRPVSPCKSTHKLDLSFVCDQEVVVKSNVMPNCEHLVQRMREEEVRKVDPSYLAHQRQLSENVRAVLLEWMMQLSQEFELTRQTYQQAVRMVDQYLSQCREQVKKGRVQLIGVTALSLGCKMEEVSSRSIKDFCLATGSLYSESQLEDMERDMARILQWRLRCPTFAFWVEPLVDLWITYRRGLHLSDLDFNEEDCNFRQNLLRILHSVLDSAVLDADSLEFQPWQLVASFILLGLCYLHGELELEEIEFSLAISAKYMLRSGIVLVVKYEEFLRKALQVELERQLISCIQFAASYFFVCKRYPLSVQLPCFYRQQQHCGRELDFLARRRRLLQAER